MTEPALTVDQKIHRPGIVLLTVAGELDHHTAPELAQALQKVPFAPGSALVINLSGLTYCDSTGITVLVTTYHRAEAAGCSLSLAGLSRELTRIFHIIGLDQVFSVHPTADDALATLSHGEQ
ncbi:STAS domain-containing protein [Streptomyces sp. G5(2025)]|uniref:STAS domain-containing protein n=1 Tax=Streptomyces sp. G5(2025) TaxID=3406628 RepID=UPI003C279637